MSAGAGAWATLLLLGALQGLTEFLPVSSSGHLVLMGHLLGHADGQDLTTEVALHFGTLVAVVLFCRRDLSAMARGASPRLWILVIGASIITAAFGLSFQATIERDLTSPLSAGLGLCVTAVLLAFVAPPDDTRQVRRIEDGGWRDALALGLFQSLALAPGVSRAGATLVCALLLGFRREESVRIAFLVSIPAVGGAVLLKAHDHEAFTSMTAAPVLAGMAVACLVGLVALRFIAVHVDPASLRRFACYCAVVGLTAILTGVAFG